ncbi:MAG: hypothetical protein AAGJ81_09390 [Verrucomicrobiota bacterium]
MTQLQFHFLATLFLSFLVWLPATGQTIPSDSNLRIGGLELDLRGSIAQAYDSNIGLSFEDPESDWITQFGLQLGGQIDLTEINSLNLSVGIEYRKYWNNPEFDSDRNSIIVTPETELELLFRIGNFDFRLFDRFSLLTDPGNTRFIDPSSNAPLTDVVVYSRINNRFGLDGIWTINPFWNANLNLSRLDIIPLDSEFRDLERHSYLGSVGLTRNVAANLDVTGQLSGSVDRYRTSFQPDSSSWSAGVGASWQPTDFLETEVFVAWTQRNFDSDGQNQDTTTESQGVTGNVSVTHLINPVLRHSIGYGRNLDLGSVSNEITVQNAQYRIDYSGFERSNLYFRVLWTEGEDSGGIDPETFDRWAFETSVGYPLSTRLEFSASYEYTIRDSNIESRNFDRNLFTVTFDYDF